VLELVLVLVDPLDDVEVEPPFASAPDAPAGRGQEGDVKAKASASGIARALEAEQVREAQRVKEARERAIGEARRTVVALEEEARGAREAAHQAEAAAERARAEADRKGRMAARAEERLAIAREALSKM